MPILRFAVAFPEKNSTLQPIIATQHPFLIRALVCESIIDVEAEVVKLKCNWISAAHPPWCDADQGPPRGVVASVYKPLLLTPSSLPLAITPFNCIITANASWSFRLQLNPANRRVTITLTQLSTLNNFGAISGRMLTRIPWSPSRRARFALQLVSPLRGQSMEEFGMDHLLVWIR